MVRAFSCVYVGMLLFIHTLKHLKSRTAMAGYDQHHLTRPLLKEFRKGGATFPGTRAPKRN